MITREQFNEIKTLPIFKSKIISGSMSPVIKMGEEIIIDVGSKNIKRFDIVVIYLEGKLVCHYLWNINEKVKPLLLQTRNMLGEKDYPIEENDYLGKVVSHHLSLWQKLKFLFK